MKIWKLRIISIMALITGLMTLSQIPCLAFTTDQANRTIIVSPAADASATTKDIQNAFNSLVSRSDKSTRWTLKFNPGRYTLSQQISAAGLENVSLISNPENPATLAKSSNWSSSAGEHIFFIRNSSKLSISGFNFYGLTDFRSGPNPVWPDQGILFASTNDVTVDNNKFYNFGNAAVRFTTYDKDPTTGVNSFNSKLTNNYFNNIYQIATTSSDTSSKHGGTANLLVQNNTFEKLRGSIKAASRTPGCENIRYIGNTIRGGDHYGFEIASCSSVEISGNTIENIKSVPINIYTNANAPVGFQWGDNIKIINNTIRNSGRGIRFSPDPYPDKSRFIPKNLLIDNNHLVGILEQNIPSISIPNGAVDGARITKNKMENVASKTYISVTDASKNVILDGNLAENKPYGPQTQTAVTQDPVSLVSQPVEQAEPTTPTSTAVKLSPPTNLLGVQKDANTIQLTWTDNASNETAQQIWIGTDGSDYKKLADIGSNVTSYTHKFSERPKNGAYYYTVRAISKADASGFSKSAKVNIATVSTSLQPLGAPTNLTANYDGKTIVQLSWTDNASSETEQQIWFGTDGSDYKLLVKLKPDATSYSHNLGSAPTVNAYYYTVRAVSGQNASGFSKAAKVTF